MHNIEEVLQECCQTLDALNIKYAKNHTVRISTQAKRYWGSCQKKSDGSYIIRISSVLLDENVPLDSLKDTIYHELLHTAPYAMSHGKVWLELAQKVNWATGLNIRRVAPAPEKGVIRDYANDPSVKFVCACKKCGAKIIRYRKCSFVQRTDRYRCANCGGTFQVIVNKF